MTPLVLVEEPAPHVVQLALNRPEQLNAMTAELCEALHVELRRIAAERAASRGDPDGRRARLLRRRGPARLRRCAG